jgi:hypothetical protein
VLKVVAETWLKALEKTLNWTNNGKKIAAFSPRALGSLLHAVNLIDPPLNCR